MSIRFARISCTLACFAFFLSCAYSSQEYQNFQERDSLRLETKLVLKKVFIAPDEFEMRVTAREKGQGEKVAWKRKRWGYWRMLPLSDSIEISVSSPSSAYMRLEGIRKTDSLVLRYWNLEGFDDTVHTFRRID
jgi:hypothetical protein